MSKGSHQRPLDKTHCSQEQFAANWARVFGGDKKKRTMTGINPQFPAGPPGRPYNPKDSIRMK